MSEVAGVVGAVAAAALIVVLALAYVRRHVGGPSYLVVVNDPGLHDRVEYVIDRVPDAEAARLEGARRALRDARVLRTETRLREAARHTTAVRT